MTDCVECGSAGSVDRGFCEVCYAEPSEAIPYIRPRSAGLPPAVPARVGGVSRDGLRFSDVVEELSAVATLAASVEDGEMLAAACGRAEGLVRALRDQFLTDLGVRVS
ncbi:MAG: hypothetical protein WD770_08785 [Actinomycetota bacterium]